MVQKNLMGVAVNDRHRIEFGKNRLNVLGVVGPKIPVAVIFVKWRVGEDDEGRLFVDGREIVLQPLAPFWPDLEARLDAVVESGDRLHPLGRSHAARGPKILFLNACLLYTSPSPR